MSFNERELFGLIVQITDEYIESVARRKGGMREDYARLMLARGGNNSDLHGLADVILDNLDTIQDNYGGHGRFNNVESLLERAIPGIVDGHFAYAVFQDKRTCDNLDDSTYRDIENAAMRFERIFLKQRGRFESNQRNSSIYSSGAIENLGNHRDRPRNNDAYERLSAYSRREEQGPQRRGKPVQSTNPTDPWAALDIPVNNTVDEEPVMARPEPTTIHKTTTHVEGIDYSKPRPFDEYWLAGSQYQIAFKSDWKLTPTDENPLAVESFYDTNKYLRYFVRNPSKVVTEEFRIVTDDTRYLQQEITDAENMTSIRKTTRYIDPTKIKESTDETSSETENIPLGTILAELPDQCFITETWKLVSDVKDAAMATKARLLSSDKDIMVGSFLTRDPCFINNTIDLNLIDQIETELGKLESCTALHQVVDVMNSLKTTLPEVLYERIDHRLSKLFMESTRYQWQFPMKSFHFSAAYQQMVDVMKERNGNEFLAMFVKRSHPLVFKALARLDPKQVKDYLSDILDEGDNPTTLLFSNYEFVVAIRKTANELGIGKQLEGKKTGVAIRDIEYTGPLLAAMRRIYASLPLTEAERSVQAIRLLTSDDRLLTVYPYQNQLKQFIISEPVMNF